jgi:hypothetical protein
MHQGYILHPQIPITNWMKIAELGTGTGYVFPALFSIDSLSLLMDLKKSIWLFDAARNLPSTVELHGYDICDGQFPAKELWPANVKLGLLDSLTDPPDALIGQYDVVHLRMWASNLQENDTTPLIRHATQLLSK